jgi:hypothetical protein
LDGTHRNGVSTQRMIVIGARGNENRTLPIPNRTRLVRCGSQIVIILLAGIFGGDASSDRCRK